MRSSTFFPVFALSLSLAPLLAHCLHNARTPALQRRQDIGSGPYELTDNNNNQCADVSCGADAVDEKASMRELTAEERSMYKRNDIAYENGGNTGGVPYSDDHGSYNADGSPGAQAPQPVDPSQDEVYGPPQPLVEEVDPQPQQQEESTIPGVSGGGSVGPLQCQPLQSTDRCQFGTYTVERGDSCSAIGRRFSVPYLEIVRINNLSPNCQNLQPNSAICLPPKCALYTVQPGDTCTGIAQSNGLAIEDFRLFNPTISNACTNLPRYADICITPPGYM